MRHVPPQLILRTGSPRLTSWTMRLLRTRCTCTRASSNRGELAPIWAWTHAGCTRRTLKKRMTSWMKHVRTTPKKEHGGRPANAAGASRACSRFATLVCPPMTGALNCTCRACSTQNGNQMQSRVCTTSFMTTSMAHIGARYVWYAVDHALPSSRKVSLQVFACECWTSTRNRWERSQFRTKTTRICVSDGVGEEFGHTTYESAGRNKYSGEHHFRRGEWELFAWAAGFKQSSGYEGPTKPLWNDQGAFGPSQVW